MPVDPEKIAKLQKSAAKKVGGTRIKAKKIVKGEPDDVKLVETLGKLGSKKIDNIEEANFFRDDGKVLHFARVGVQGAPDSNVFGFNGLPQVKDVTQLIPQILPQLGAENLNILRKLAEQIQAGKTPEELAAAGGVNEDDDIPDLVEGQKFDEVE